MKHITLSIYIGIALCTDICAQSFQQKAESLAADPVLSHACTGISMIKADGESLAEVGSRKMLVPASNMKLLTTGAALCSLGPDYRFRTDLCHDGIIEEGTLHGNIYIVGNGDPTLGSRDSIATDIDRIFSQWEKSVRDAGIRRIDGHIIGDGRWLDGMSEEPTWLWNDIGTYYGTGVTGLMFYENMQSFNVSPGNAEGEPPVISPSYPDCPWMTFIYNCTTGKKGTGDKLYMYTAGLAPVAEIRGTFGIDRGRKRVDCSNKYPELTCAEYFCRFLEKHGISCSGGASDFRLKTGWMDRMKPPGNLKLLHSSFSPSLERIIYETNHDSNNLFAETLLRTMGKEMRQSSCYDSSYLAINDVMKKMRLDTTHGLRIQDGSGLSRQNHVTAEFICSFLKAMMDSEHFEEYLFSLPYPGGDGTLSYNMKGYPEELRSRIRMKSGSMNGVRCYSGYILPAGFPPTGKSTIPVEIRDEIVIFSILTNNCISPNWKVRPLLDRFMAEAAGYKP